VIKYIGSKRLLVPLLVEAIARIRGSGTVCDLFSGTSRVGHALKRAGYRVVANDHNAYAAALATCYVQADAEDHLRPATRLVAELNALPPRPGYFTATFCERSRFFKPRNGARVDAIREAIARKGLPPELEAILLVSLMEAADRVDSTTGVQMAYVKQWADRSFKDIELRVPELVAGPGEAVRADAVDAVKSLGGFDLAYLDPPYNQHRYFTNYHVWETLVAWDAPEHYGIACKRVDARDDSTKSVFNNRKAMPSALTSTIRAVDAELVVVSYNNESWVAIDELETACRDRGGAVATLAFDSRRYVGAQIGIHNPDGEKVGQVSHLRNVEYVVCAGEAALVGRIADKGDELWKLPATSHS